MTGKLFTIPLLRAPVLDAIEGLRHGFTTREGGVSTGLEESLNLAQPVVAAPGGLTENWRRVAAELGTTPDRVASLKQVHGSSVIRVVRPAGPFEPLAEADAAVTTEEEVVLCVRTADCVPILLASPTGIGAVHAGWRGTAAGVVPRAVEALREATGDDDIVAAVGPHISGAVYEVGEEVVEGLSSIPREVYVRPGTRGRPHVDLGAAVAWQLREAGVDKIGMLGLCTYTDRRFYSHRRDGPGTGRLAALIVRRR